MFVVTTKKETHVYNTGKSTQHWLLDNIWSKHIFNILYERLRVFVVIRNANTQSLHGRRYICVCFWTYIITNTNTITVCIRLCVYSLHPAKRRSILACCTVLCVDECVYFICITLVSTVTILVICRYDCFLEGIFETRSLLHFSSWWPYGCSIQSILCCHFSYLQKTSVDWDTIALE